MKSIIYIFIAFSAFNISCSSEDASEVAINKPEEYRDNTSKEVDMKIDEEEKHLVHLLSESEVQKLVRIKKQDMMMDINHLDRSFFEAYYKSNKLHLDYFLRRSGLTKREFTRILGKAKFTLDKEPSLRLEHTKLANIDKRNREVVGVWEFKELHVDTRLKEIESLLSIIKVTV